MISKTELRKQFLQKRKQLNTSVLSSLICEKIILLKEYENAKNIFAYYPMSFEVDIKNLFFDDTKKWYLPRVEGEFLKFYEYKTGDELEKSHFGVLEPKFQNSEDIKPDLIIVPALAVDNNNYRLGYGKGFYDRFLSQLNFDVTTITPIFSDLMVEKLPSDIYDKKIDIIVTDIN